VEILRRACNHSNRPGSLSCFNCGKRLQDVNVNAAAAEPSLEQKHTAAAPTISDAKASTSRGNCGSNSRLGCADWRCSNYALGPRCWVRYLSTSTVTKLLIKSRWPRLRFCSGTSPHPERLGNNL
jgi:hypothetical protein